MADLTGDPSLASPLSRYLQLDRGADPSPEALEMLIDTGLADILMDRGIDSGGELNSLGQRVQGYIDRANRIRILLGC